MTLLCELTDAQAKKHYFDALGTDNEKYVPTIFGHHLYIFLYQYLSNSANKVSFIEILKPADAKIEKLFNEILKYYSPDIVDYKSALEIEGWFPEDYQLQDNSLRVKISNMINNIRFIDSSKITDEDYLCYLPLCGTQLNKAMQQDKVHSIIYTNQNLTPFKIDKLISLDQTNFKEVQNKITVLQNNYKKIFNENIVEAKYFQTPKYLENFDKTYIEDLKMAKYNTDKELYFYGAEDYTAKEGIDYLLGPYNYREYDLFENMWNLKNDDRAFVFLNFHRLLNQDKQNDLAERIQELKLKKHAVIQGDNLKLISFFNKFRKIKVPDEKEIKKLISGILISFLVLKNKYKDRAWTLYPFVKHGLLDDLLTEVNSPKALLQVIDNMGEITKTDLLENVSFWCLFLEKYEKELSEINKNKVKVPEQQLDEWILEISEKQYRVIYPLADTGPIKYKQFMTYLLLLIRYSEKYTKPLSVDLLRKAMIKYGGKKSPNEIDPETARIAVSKIFNQAKKDNEWFEAFYNSYIRYENYEYSLDLSLLKLMIIGFELKNDFFNKL
ncbi:MAG: hypothetical protein KDC90_08050 [Ignavibacteriae bacterium]|nr:hypothetical protein [Ignavibacteriota bacterium]MCB9210911.1 hypothetical protein [Ignavibacteriales bacterium]